MLKTFKESDNAYNIITCIGTSTESWEKAAVAAVEQASKTLDDLRIAEVEELDILLDDEKILNYRTKVRISFKYHSEFHEYHQDPTTFLTKNDKLSMDGG